MSSIIFSDSNIHKASQNKNLLHYAPNPGSQSLKVGTLKYAEKNLSKILPKVPGHIWLLKGGIDKSIHLLVLTVAAGHL